ncbi:hypothetical protein [Janthinobacterium sp.]|uniref:hypothetical protein n=1 Tax=Janthinobacterium sp. TaxID=1871054 RepID=UPI00293D8772|nr:hypothetical protein [Janthinobacterium sp.]
MTTLPNSAECRCLLPDGRTLTVTATRRPRANRADVKCALAGAPALCERMQEVVRLARHTEARFDSRDQVVLSMDIAPLPRQRDWELAAVLADRMVRGVYRAARAPVYAQGWSDAWHLGRMTGAMPTAAPPQPCTLVVGGEGGERLAHLGALSGHTDPAASVSSARAWFPLHSGGINDSLAWVEVSVHPLERHGADEEDTIAAPGLDPTEQLGLRQALAGARHFDGRGLGRWRSVVRFGENRFPGNSYELALVLADRLARGRECVPRGRLIASGCSAAWHAGRVDSVEGRAPKLALILAQALEGDRVLLPAAWRDGADAFAAALKARGASLAWIERIGMI